MPPKKRTRDTAGDDDAPKKGAWMKHDSVLLLSKHPKMGEGARVQVAAFDMDDTLVCPKNGATFPKSRTDWQWLCDQVPDKLKELHAKGYIVVIISNQNGLEKDKDGSKTAAVTGKIEDLNTKLGIPISAALATGKDEFRKPEKKLWDLVITELLHGAEVDYEHSFYVGDAAGRTITTMANRKKDFSCGDKKFALNAGLTFHTPEAYYLGKKEAPTVNWDGISLDELKALPKESKVQPKVFAPSEGKYELVIFVGYPGSGKSTFFKKHFKAQGYAWANRDTLKNMDKCAQMVRQTLGEKKSVVVDNTNPAADDRAVYLRLAKEAGATARCFYFSADKELANHMNIVRMRLGIADRVSSIAYNIFKGKFTKPEVKEGFTEVVEVAPTADVDAADAPPGLAEAFFQLS